MKTKEEILAPIMPVVLDKNFSRAEKEEYILQAMEEYKNQSSNDKPKTMATAEPNRIIVNYLVLTSTPNSMFSQRTYTTPEEVFCAVGEAATKGKDWYVYSCEGISSSVENPIY